MPATTQVSPPQSSDLLTRIRLCLALLISGLLLSGIATFPLVSESQWLLDHLARTIHFGAGTPGYDWILRVHLAIAASAIAAPFLAFGTDLLALSQILFAVLFLGPYYDPIRNRWVINFGLIGCIGVLLLAFIAGPLRGIPLFWRCAYASFAIVAAFLLLLCRHYLHILDNIKATVRRQRSQRLERRQARKPRDRRPLS